MPKGPKPAGRLGSSRWSGEPKPAAKASIVPLLRELAFAETREGLLPEAVFLGPVADLASDRFDQRGHIQRRSRGGCLRDVAAAQKWGDGADEFGQLRLDDGLHLDELGTGGRRRLGRRDGTWRGVRRRRG